MRNFLKKVREHNSLGNLQKKELKYIEEFFLLFAVEKWLSGSSKIYVTYSSWMEK